MRKPPATADNDANIDRLIAQYAGMRGALLPMLHALQAELGYIDDEVVPKVAMALNLSRADVHGVVTFYHDFRREPAGRRILKLCSAEACQAHGALELIAEAERRLGVAMHATTPDRAITLEPVYCLGLCAVAPAAMLDGEVYGRLTIDRFDALLTAARS